MRKHCPVCGYPALTCICHALQPILNDTEIIILQHPKEASHAKNTVNLLKFVVAKLTICVGKSAQDFTQLQSELTTLPKHTVVFYPAPDSLVLPDYSAPDNNPIKRAIFIDGSWKQAYAIWQCNSWLNDFPFYQLPVVYEGQYHIRQSKLSYSLSTLEAVAYSLRHIEQLSPNPLLNLQKAFMERWQQFVPGAK